LLTATSSPCDKHYTVAVADRSPKMRMWWDNNKDWMMFACVFYVPMGILLAIAIIWDI
jgi:hypothetical protein